MLPVNCCFIWQNGFRKEEFLDIDRPETRIAYGDHVCQQIGTKFPYLVRIIQLIWLPWAVLVCDRPIKKNLL